MRNLPIIRMPLHLLLLIIIITHSTLDPPRTNSRSANISSRCTTTHDPPVDSRLIITHPGAPNIPTLPPPTALPPHVPPASSSSLLSAVVATGKITSGESSANANNLLVWWFCCWCLWIPCLGSIHSSTYPLTQSVRVGWVGVDVFTLPRIPWGLSPVHLFEHLIWCRILKVTVNTVVP